MIHLTLIPGSEHPKLIIGGKGDGREGKTVRYTLHLEVENISMITTIMEFLVTCTKWDIGDRNRNPVENLIIWLSSRLCAAANDPPNANSS